MLAWLPLKGLLLCAKYLLVEAVVAVLLARESNMGIRASQVLNADEELASIPTAQGGLSRLAIARLKSAGVPVEPLLRHAGLTPEAIADRKSD
jgi:hypothetical protein